MNKEFEEQKGVKINGNNREETHSHLST